MHLAMIGTGYVGLVSGACFAELGHHVTCIDMDKAKIEALKKGTIPIYEPGLENVVARNVRAKKLQFITGIENIPEDIDCVFLAVGTPTNEKDGSADLSHVFAAVEALAKLLPPSAMIVTKSTVPVGTGQQIRAKLKKLQGNTACEVISNPEFLREGSAVEDFLYPDRIVIGAESEKALHLMQELYRPLLNRGVPLLHTDIPTAELIKYAANAFLATKLSFINQVADLCETVGANVVDVARGIGMDKRIGTSYLQPGPGYGGSCLPKDTQALAHTARQHKAPLALVESVIAENLKRKKQMATKIAKACGGSLKGKRIAILGVTFKANTDDMREAPSLVILPELLEQGAELAAYDPAGMASAKPLLPKEIHWCKDAATACKKADAIVILTEWEEFKALDYATLKNTLAQPVIVDLRNLLDGPALHTLGYRYYNIGMKYVPPLAAVKKKEGMPS